MLFIAGITILTFCDCTKEIRTRPNFKMLSLAADTSYSSLSKKLAANGLDTLWITTKTVVTTKITFDTTIHKYVPVNGGGGVYKRPKYKAVAAFTVNNQTNTTISLDSINSGLKNVTQLVLNNCNGVHITKMYFTNTTGKAVILNNCTNTIIDSCFFGTIAFGVDAKNCTNTVIINNQFLNLYDVGNMGNQFAHFVQFESCTRGKVNNNKMENVLGQCLAPHDIINLYASKGLPGDSIQVWNNWIRGGQTAVNGVPDAGATNGAAGIVAGEYTSSFISVRGNILVNPGYVGIQPQTASNLTIDHNKIYSIKTPASLVALSMFSYSATVAKTIYFGNNQLKWLKYSGSEFDIWCPGSQPVGLSTNTQGAKIDATILPTTIITWK